MEYWWQESGLHFECVGCGGCCGGAPGVVRTTHTEREKIAEYLNISVADLKKTYMMYKYGTLTFAEMDNYNCVFLDEQTKKCRIYPVRPRQCRTFPFWPDLMKDKDMWDLYAASCRGMNCGRFYAPEILEKLLNATSENNDNRE